MHTRNELPHTKKIMHTRNELPRVSFNSVVDEQTCLLIQSQNTTFASSRGSKESGCLVAD